MKKYLLPLFIVVMDILILIIAVLLGLALRFEGNIPANYLATAVWQLPFFVLGMLAVHLSLRLYTRIWQYAGSVEALAIVGACVADMVVWFCISFIMGKFLPRSVYVIVGIIFLILVGALRFSLRVYSYLTSRPEYKQRQRQQNVLIYGAGDAGAMILREIYNRAGNRCIVGFIDDDPNKKGRIFSGIKILGTRELLLQIVNEKDVREIIIAMPSVKGQVMREIVAACRETGVAITTLPGLYEIIDGTAHISQLRPVEVTDLLGRSPVKLDNTAVSSFLSDKTILITGAGGSIGSEICRQCAKMHPRKLLLLGKGENSIYEINRELETKFPYLKKVPIIADVRDRERIKGIMEYFHPQIVFHAAAHKHVPLMEYQPMEAVRNNILGTKTVAEEAAAIDVEKFVMISTDKAVNPTSVMGCTKRVAEMFVQSMNAVGATKYVAVRFGNVLGSRGSVIPLFKKQIAAGGPVTVTDPEMKRYFMTIPEASQLVLQAGAMAQGGEVFVLDMGEPVKIVDLARDLITLSGLTPDVDIPIVFTGLRPGEKLFEELLSAEDGTDTTDYEKIYVARIKTVEKSILDQQITELLAISDEDQVVDKLGQIVPTYTPNREYRQQ